MLMGILLCGTIEYFATCIYDSRTLTFVGFGVFMLVYAYFFLVLYEEPARK